MTPIKKMIAAGALAGMALLAPACTSDADRASENLSKAAEQFEVTRRVVVFNGITDKILLQVEGRCSLESAESALVRVPWRSHARLGRISTRSTSPDSLTTSPTSRSRWSPRTSRSTTIA